MSIPEVIRRAQLLNIVEPGETIHRGTAWRTACRMGLETKRRRTAKTEDVRRWHYAHRMQMTLCDGKHFRAGVSRARRVALFFLDDATRFGLHVVVGTSENAALFLRGLYETVRMHGIMDAFFMDKGPGFIAGDTKAALGNLGVPWIHGRTRYPAGHGKIERLNQTALHQVLQYLPRRPEVDPDCGALELRVQHWLRERYNEAPHESLGGGMSPRLRWREDSRPLRFPENDADLRRNFVIHESRRVSEDNVVSLEGTLYEVPRGHRGERVVLHRHLLDGTVSTLHEERQVVLAPVDPIANATNGRARTRRDHDEVDHHRPPAAAELAFRRDLAPVVGPDGGFYSTNPKEE